MCFVWLSEQTAIISLYNINRLVCITETESVYCAVRTETLDIIQANPSLQGAVLWLRRLVAGLSPRRFSFDPTATYVRLVVDLWWTTWDWGTSFPFSILLPMFHSHLHVALSRRTKKRSLGNFQKKKLFRNSESIGEKRTFSDINNLEDRLDATIKIY